MKGLDLILFTFAGVGTTIVAAAAFALLAVFVNAENSKADQNQHNTSGDEISPHGHFSLFSFRSRALFPSFPR